MYGYMYIYNIFLHWMCIYIYILDIYMYTWNLGVYFLFQGIYHKQILHKNRTPRILPIKGGVINRVTGKYIYIYMHICCLYIWNQGSILAFSNYMATLNHSYQRNQTLNMQIFSFLSFLQLLWGIFLIIILSPRKWIRIIQ